MFKMANMSRLWGYTVDRIDELYKLRDELVWNIKEMEDDIKDMYDHLKLKMRILTRTECLVDKILEEIKEAKKCI